MFKDCLTTITSILSMLVISYNEEIAKDGLTLCTKAVRNLKKRLKLAKSVGQKRALQSAIADIKTQRNLIKAEKKRGAGITTQRKESPYRRIHWDDLENAFDNRIRTGVITNLKHQDPRHFLHDCFTLFKRRIANALKKYEAVKVNAALGGRFSLQRANRVMEEAKYFTTQNSPIYHDTVLEEWFTENVINPILTQLEEFQERDSGWTLKSITNLGININKFTPQLGSSYIDLPAPIKAKQACINIKNDDNACFAWAVTSALYPIPMIIDITPIEQHPIHTIPRFLI